MTKRSYIQINGVLYDKSEPLPEGVYPTGQGERRSATVMGDLPDFVSPIDGSVVNGRKGMREHCAKHDVVPTADLKGLPPKQAVSEYRPDREGIKRDIARTIDQLNRH